MAKQIVPTDAIKILRQYMAQPQLEVMAEGCYGEEGEFFAEKLFELAAQIRDMPKTYEQDGKGDDAIVTLHYFLGGMDWYITEKDQEDEQLQAFGFANLGYGGELGYISIVELLQNHAELDIHWTPKTLGAVKVAAA